jgi:cystathionine gamma-lyase
MNNPRPGRGERKKSNMSFKHEDFLTVTHLGEKPEEYFNAVVPPIFSNSLHIYKTLGEFSEGRYSYGRAANPLVEIVEEKIAALERGEKALLFSAGMAAATTAIMHACSSGGHVICQSAGYNPVKTFFERVCAPKLNMEMSYCSCLDLDELESSIRPNTQLIIFESPSSAVFDIVDIEGIAKIAKKHGVKTYFDNTYSTPLFQKPLDLGVDYSMHTLSKYLGGHSDLIGGVLIVSEHGEEIRRDFRELFGGIIGPFEAWLVLRGMRTLPARLTQHQTTALEAARFLNSHPKVRKVYHPGLPEHPGHELAKKQMSGYTGLFSLELDASVERSMVFCDALKLFGKGVSWGGFESLVTMPMRRASEAIFNQFHCDRNLIRLHCGLEGMENLLADLSQALEKV